jgi:hypothetical protein
LVRFETLANIFKRGVPLNQDLRDHAIARIFSNVLRKGSVVESEFAIGEDATALGQCFRNGWLHADKLRNIHYGKETVYIFPSPLHRWFVEWKLWDSVPTIPFESNSILQLALEVIARFSPRLLATERIIGPGCIQRPPEAQYQDEFYRCCHAYSNGSLITFPEYGTAKGRADFYIPSRQWGVELLREGDRLEQHSGRFSRSGSYETTLPVSDYIILDCRNTWPKHPHPSMCINCPTIHFPFFQANCILRHSKIVPRCIQQWVQGRIHSGPLAATCSWWRTEVFSRRVILIWFHRFSIEPTPTFSTIFLFLLIAMLGHAHV